MRSTALRPHASAITTACICSECWQPRLGFRGLSRAGAFLAGRRPTQRGRSFNEKGGQPPSTVAAAQLPAREAVRALSARSRRRGLVCFAAVVHDLPTGRTPPAEPFAYARGFFVARGAFRQVPEGPSGVQGRFR